MCSPQCSLHTTHRAGGGQYSAAAKLTASRQACNSSQGSCMVVRVRCHVTTCTLEKESLSRYKTAEDDVSCHSCIIRRTSATLVIYVPQKSYCHLASSWAAALLCHCCHQIKCTLEQMCCLLPRNLLLGAAHGPKPHLELPCCCGACSGAATGPTSKEVPVGASLNTLSLGRGGVNAPLKPCREMVPCTGVEQ